MIDNSTLISYKLLKVTFFLKAPFIQKTSAPNTKNIGLNAFFVSLKYKWNDFGPIKY